MRNRICLCLLFVLTVLLGFAFYKAEKLLFITDISTQPIDRTATPDAVRNGEELSRDPVYLVSYADGDEFFFRNQNALAASAVGKGVDVIMNYKRSMLDPAFVEENKDILRHKKGAGYWLWKPWIILDAMKRAPENAVIIYLDGGSLVKSSLVPLIEMLQENDMVLTYYEGQKTADHAKREAFIRMGCDHATCYNGPEFWAGFVVLRNNERTRDFIEKWLNFAEDPNILIEGPSSAPELEALRRHLHDQAILSILYNLYPEGKKIISFDEEVDKKYISWAHRKKDSNPDDPLFIYKSLVPYARPDIRKIERLFYNARPLLWLRKKVFERAGWA